MFQINYNSHLLHSVFSVYRPCINDSCQSLLIRCLRRWFLETAIQCVCTMPMETSATKIFSLED